MRANAEPAGGRAALFPGGYARATRFPTYPPAPPAPACVRLRTAARFLPVNRQCIDGCAVSNGDAVGTCVGLFIWLAVITALYMTPRVYAPFVCLRATVTPTAGGFIPAAFLIPVPPWTFCSGAVMYCCPQQFRCMSSWYAEHDGLTCRRPDDTAFFAVPRRRGNMLTDEQRVRGLTRRAWHSDCGSAAPQWTLAVTVPE